MQRSALAPGKLARGWLRRPNSPFPFLAIDLARRIGFNAGLFGTQGDPRRPPWSHWALAFGCPDRQGYSSRTSFTAEASWPT